MMRVAAISMMLAATAAADPKPTLAVVTVVPKDDDVAKTADAVTAGLRAVAAAKPGRYRTAGAPKAITAALDKADCDARKPVCAATIGAALGVDYVVTGELASRGEHPVLVLALVDVHSHERIRSVRDSVGRKMDARRWAAKVYDRLIGATTGELTVVANAQRGDIVVDGVLAGALFDGRATLTGVALGSHALEIRAPGYRPFEIEVTVDASTTQTLLLDPMP